MALSLVRNEEALLEMLQLVKLNILEETNLRDFFLDMCSKNFKVQNAFKLEPC